MADISNLRQRRSSVNGRVRPGSITGASSICYGCFHSWWKDADRRRSGPDLRDGAEKWREDV